MNAKELYNKEVIDSKGISIGKVADIDIDIVKGVVYHVLVSGGYGRRYEIPVDKVVSIGDKILLKIEKAELGQK